MFCEKCGKELEEGSKFCEGCGEKVDLGITEPEEVAAAPVSKAVEEVIEKPGKKEEKTVIAETKIVKSVPKTKPLGVFAFIWMLILMAIPVVNIVMVFIWAFGKNKNVNKKNYSWAVIILSIIVIAGAVAAYIQLKLDYNDIWDALMNAFEELKAGF